MLENGKNAVPVQSLDIEGSRSYHELSLKISAGSTENCSLLSALCLIRNPLSFMQYM